MALIETRFFSVNHFGTPEINQDLKNLQDETTKTLRKEKNMQDFAKKTLESNLLIYYVLQNILT